MKNVLFVFAVATSVLAGCNADSVTQNGERAPVDASKVAGQPAPTGPRSAAPAAPATTTTGAFTPLADPRGTISQGRCHMDACSWTKWDKVEVVKTSADELELRTWVTSGQSEHPRRGEQAPDYPKHADGVQIEWEARQVTATYRCSKTRPTMQWGDENAVVLPLNPDGFIPGAMEGAVRSYFVACHGDFSDGPGDALVLKYGYRAPLTP